MCSARSRFASSMNGLFSSSVKSFHSAPVEVAKKKRREMCILFSESVPLLIHARSRGRRREFTQQSAEEEREIETNQKIQRDGETMAGG